MIVAWWGTRLECAAALARQWRQGVLGADAQVSAHARLERLARGWSVVGASEELLGLALRLVRVHPLRAGDALQLAAAVTWSQPAPASPALVSLDHVLRDAAMREGFTVLPERL